MIKSKYKIGDNEYMAYIMEIVPMYVGNKKDDRLEPMLIAKILDPKTELYKQFQFSIKEKTRLYEEVSKLIDIFNAEIDK